jgi:hypothetical protein
MSDLIEMLRELGMAEHKVEDVVKVVGDWIQGRDDSYIDHMEDAFSNGYGVN